MNTPRRHAPRHGVALLLVLITMAAATTLVMGWLAVQDTSPLVGRNAVRAAEARSAAQAGLELAVALLETDAPWRTDHQNGWVLKQHELAGGIVSVRLWDALSDPLMPPGPGTTSVRVEYIAVVDDMTQTATAQATVHPFDASSMGDVNALALYADDQLVLSGTSKVRSWRSFNGRRLVGIGSDEPGAVHLQGAGTRAGTAGTDLVLPASGGSSVITGSGRTGLARARRQRPVPELLGLFGLPRMESPTMPNELPGGTEEVLVDGADAHHWHNVVEGDVAADMVVAQGATLVLPAGTTVLVAGDLILEHGATIKVADGGRATLLIEGDLWAEGATIGTLTPARRRTNKPRAADATALHVRAVGGDAQWSLMDGTLMAAHLDAPGTQLHVEQSAVVGRLAAGTIELANSRIWYDPRLQTGLGLGALANTIDRMDLLDRRDGGLDAPTRAAVLERLVRLTAHDSGRHGRPTSPPEGDWWLLRPVLVQAQMDRYGGDTKAWEAAALAAAGDTP